MIFIFGVFMTYSTYYCHFDNLWIHDVCVSMYVLMNECVCVHMYAYMHVCFWCCDILSQNLVVSVTNFCFKIGLFFFRNKIQNVLLYNDNSKC